MPYRTQSNFPHSKIDDLSYRGVSKTKFVVKEGEKSVGEVDFITRTWLARTKASKKDNGRISFYPNFIS
jgi:hypothetical protein